MTNGITLGSIQQLTGVTMTQDGTHETPPRKPGELPNNPQELLEALEAVFQDRLPDPQTYLTNPECIWVLYGQQNVLQWIRARLKK